MEVYIAIFIIFLAAPLAPVVRRISPAHCGKILALAPLLATALLAGQWSAVAGGEVLQSSWMWAPELDVSLAFRVDGFSLLFALLISGIGTGIVLYAEAYLGSTHPKIVRFYVPLFIFMGAMLGIVLSDNLIGLFVFWELTSISSYLLIGFDHERPAARRAALQALLVTGGGGLALLAGIVLMGLTAGTFSITAILDSGDILTSSTCYIPILVLVLVGAFTKSAQFPFHFWLPNAMEAPTPVSAFLHSATMVKAGVFLLARLHPALGGTSEWFYTLTLIGGITMLWGVWLAICQTDLKRILAYTTVSVLGILTFTLGFNTPHAVEGALLFLIAHSLYKGALFMIAGGVDHEAGSRDVRVLGGLRRKMPLTAALAALAGLSMAGVPPLFGFLAKETIYAAALEMGAAATLLTGAVLLTNILMVAAAGIVCWGPFWGPQRETPKEPHEGPWTLWIGALVLAVFGLFLGLAPGAINAVLSSAVTCVSGVATVANLHLWHGLNLPFALSGITLVAGIALYFVVPGLRRLPVSPLRADPVWDRLIDGLLSVATLQTRIVQSGLLRVYVTTVFAVVLLLSGYFVWSTIDLSDFEIVTPLYPLDLIVALLTAVAAFAAASARTRLSAIVALGVVGLSIALIFVIYGAADLAMTQILVETLTVLLFVLSFRHLPFFGNHSSRKARMRDGTIAIAVGCLMTCLVLVAVNIQFYPTISRFFAENSLDLAHGRNVVNVILVDFRALDTLGEISVLAIAGLGAFALLRLNSNRKEP